MSDRYRYPRPRSPVYNPARASLPINISGWADHHHDHHSHVIPASRREILPVGTRSSSGGGVVTTYKVQADPPARSSSTRQRRSSTMDSGSRPPAIITTTNRQLRPIIHSGGARPASPLKNPYRSSEEGEYYSVPASSRGIHRKRYSATMDNADMSRLARERESNRLRVGNDRGGTLYVGTTSRAPTYPATRRPDVGEYGEDGYNYTGPRDLVQYDLNNTTPRAHVRRDSSEGSRRPTSISGYNDIAPRSYDPRERGPPPSTRGFDRIPGRVSTWDQAPVRMPVPPVEPVQRPAPFEPMDPIRRTGSARPATTTYQDSRDRERRRSRDDFYEVRDDERIRKPIRQDTYDEGVEQRGFGIRTEEPARIERDRVERSDWDRSDRERNDRERIDRERSDRERTDRDRNDRPPRSDRERYGREDERDHKGRDAVATGISIAGAALGLNAAKNSLSRADDDREERRRREDEREERRYRDERDVLDTKDRRYREDERDRSPREFPRDPRDPRDIPPPRDLRDIPPPREPQYAPNSAYVDPRDRERPPSRGERDRELDPRRERRLHPDHGSSAIDSRSDGSDDARPPRARRESRNRRESQSQLPAPAGAFNPKDTMDLKALKDALNAKDGASPPIPPKIPLKEPHSNRTPRGSMSRDPRDLVEVRNELNDRRSRDAIPPNEERQLRVVSPPRLSSDTSNEAPKPIKGILRQPRPAFPEDPSPVREGVAPLKDARKDGVPPDARWTKISRKLVNPEALEAGKERYEAREDFVIVLRVLSRDEVQGYAEVTQRIRAAREELEAQEREERRRARRERHRRERNGELPPRRRRRRREHESSGAPGGGSAIRESNSESDTTEDEDDDRVRDAPPGQRMLDGGQRKRAAFSEDVLMSGGLGDGGSGKEGERR